MTYSAVLGTTLPRVSMTMEVSYWGDRDWQHVVSRMILEKFAKLSLISTLADQLGRLKESCTALRAVMEEAGQMSRPTAVGSDYRCGDYSDFEICLSRPSISATNFLKV